MLLVVGWKSLIASALERLDLDYVIVVDLEDLGSARACAADARRVLSVGDCRDVEQVLSAVERAGFGRSSFDTVYTGSEALLVPVAALAELFAAKCLVSVESALKFRDKSLQKSAVRAAGLATSRAMVIDDIAGALPSRLPIEFPAVLKPVAGVSSLMTVRVDSRAELETLLSVIHTRSGRPVTFYLEEFSAGDEYHVDGVVREGSLRVLGVSRYLNKPLQCRDGAVIGSYVLDPDAHPEIYSRIHDIAETCLDEFGLMDGVFHLELFKDGDSYVFGECGARPGGGFIVQTMKLKFGIDLYEEQIRALVGAEPTPPKVNPNAIGFTMLAAAPGSIVKAPRVNEVLERRSVRDAVLNIEPGGVMPDMRGGSIHRAGLVTLEAGDDAALLDSMNDLVGWFSDNVNVLPA
ncbi:ATP-grasp domain-containing protein [Nonomuraea sp. NPDC050404]|uniref:ATP-grasp domain-containing protein n=1 Tax=Nonomuraea sp. NPDC050404 TaxID=3155783 RepID=UPI0033D81188